MNVDITFNTQDETAILNFQCEDFKTELHKNECTAIIAMIGASFGVHEIEIDLELLEEFLSSARENEKTALEFEINDEGLDLQFK